MFPEGVLNSLLIKGIEYQIDLILRTVIPIRPNYRSNHEEIKELQKQVEKLISKVNIRENISLYVYFSIIGIKKDGSWRICVDRQDINNITIKYRHLIAMLDELCSYCVLLRLI